MLFVMNATYSLKEHAREPFLYLLKKQKITISAWEKLLMMHLTSMLAERKNSMLEKKMILLKMSLRI